MMKLGTMPMLSTSQTSSKTVLEVRLNKVPIRNLVMRKASQVRKMVPVQSQVDQINYQDTVLFRMG